MKSTVLLCLFACFLKSLNAELHTELIENEPWEFLILAQFWPGSSCIYYKGDCRHPQGVKGWTIHGLWPSNQSKEQPAFCNQSMPFNYTEIESLRPKLDIFWPNYDNSTNSSHLWQHEWEKHGTCSYSLPIIRGEYNYFNKTMELYSQLDTYDVLSRAGIVPVEDKLYDLNHVFIALHNVYKYKPQIECYHSEGKYYLDQLYLCYDKTLNLKDCPELPSSSLWSLNSGVQRPKSHLLFESERLPSGAEKQKGYFSNCPNSNKVYYKPKPFSN